MALMQRQLKLKDSTQQLTRLILTILRFSLTFHPELKKMENSGSHNTLKSQKSARFQFEATRQIHTIISILYFVYLFQDKPFDNAILK
jgi:hypothetical protein